MTKNGKVEIGRTPSVVTGDLSTAIVEGEPVTDSDVVVDPELKKLASTIEVPNAV